MSKADRTRQMIIERSAPLFNMNGYAGTSLSDIMKVTGLAKGGLYGNFKNKDEIAAQTFEYSYQRVKSAIMMKLCECNTCTERLVAILKFYREYLTNSPVDGGCPLLNTSVEADDSFPFLKSRARAAQNEMLESLVQLFEQGKKSGEFSKTIKPRGEAENMYALIEGSLVMAKINDNPTILHRNLDRLRERIEDELAS